jgi:hypothetical protein
LNKNIRDQFSFEEVDRNWSINKIAEGGLKNIKPEQPFQ